MTVYRHYTRAQINQRRVVGIAIVAILIGSISGILTPTEKQRLQTQKEQEIKSCVEQRDNAFQKCVNQLWLKWGKK
jgi:hypothetical protein